jgi:aryl-alcohol dehydrogenase-like predicted oxidoreductase
MDARTLGSTGLAVSRLGLGLAALGRPGYVNIGHGADLAGKIAVDDLERRTHAVLDAAWDSGIRYVDAARSYGRAEEFLASWLSDRRIQPDELTIGTKWGYTYTANWQVSAVAHEIKDHDLGTLRRQWAETRALLGGQVDLLQVHSASLDSGVLDDARVHDELARLRSDGEVAAIGLSLSGAAQAETLRRAMAVTSAGRRVFDVVQATWNALEPSIGTTLAEASAEGMGVIVKEALANGRLVRGPDAEPVAEQARRLGKTPDAVALAYAMEQPWADVLLSGAVSVEQLGDNLAAAELRLDDEARAALHALALHAEGYWRDRAAMAWN